MSGKSKSITESEFIMWRAVFAFAFVDNNLSLEEQELLKSYLYQVPFSTAQLVVLREDIQNPKDVVPLYRKITDHADKKRFCVSARAIVWCEGDMTGQEKEILKRVSCMYEKAEEGILHSTRNHGDVDHYYQQYAKSGVMGLFKQLPLLQLSA